MNPYINLAYLVASVLFILCLRGLSSPEAAKRGIFLGELGMLIAVVATLLHKGDHQLRVDRRGLSSSARGSGPRSRSGSR